MKIIKSFIKDETGLEYSEYAVAAALIVVGLVAAFVLFRDEVKVRIEALAAIIKN